MNTFATGMLIPLLRKEFQLEWRRRHALAGVLLYALSTVFVCYLALQRVDAAAVWNALLWITALFASFNALQRTFQQESGGTFLYLYTLASPHHVILAKMLYYAALAAVLNMVSFLFLVLFFGTSSFPAIDYPQFLVGLLLGSTGLGIALTFIAGLAFRSGAGNALVAILGFPVLMPLLITTVRYSQGALAGMEWAENGFNLLVLLILNGAFLVLSLVLFPYLWRE